LGTPIKSSTYSNVGAFLCLFPHVWIFLFSLSRKGKPDAKEL